MNFKVAALGLALATYSVFASADVTTIDNRAAFNALGTIVHNSNFADFGSGFGFPGTPFTRGDVTYTSGQNLTVGAGTGYSIGASQTVMSNNYWTPLNATVAGSHNLLGFDAAVTSGPVTITVTTNQSSYVFSGLTLGNGAPDFTFKGFQATGAGEVFTGFRIDTVSSGYLPGVTNVAVGAVPEPETYAMMLAGIGLLGLMKRRASAKNKIA
jgi:PEP-CTERM motif